MKPPVFTIPYAIVDNLPVKERFLYYELCRLAATEEKTEEDFGISLKKGSLVTSNYRMAKIMDCAYSTATLAMEGLAVKDLIDIIPIEHEEFSSYYIVDIKDFDYGDHPVPTQDRLFPF